MKYRILFLLLFPILILGQSISQNSLKKLDPKLISILKPEQKIISGSPLLTPLVNPLGKLPDGQDIYGAIVYTSQPDALKTAGIRPQSVYSNFVTVRITPGDLVKLVNLDQVNFVKADELLYPTNDVSKGLIGADLLQAGYINNTPFKGSGVIVGVIDTGIDWKHLDFRSPADPSKSRILYLWDVTLTAQGSESTPSDFNYGVEYTQAQINNELDGSPANFVREQDINGHGTHVAGSAAGNGASLLTRDYSGIAPEADLIIVKAGEGSFTSTDLINAINYIQNRAAALNKPVVINMSLGSIYGSHDGTDPKSVAVDGFCGNGRVAVVAAGNDGGAPVHVSGTVPAGGTSDVTLTVPSYTASSGAQNDNFAMDIWFDNNSSVDVTVLSPNNYSTFCRADNYLENRVNDGDVYINNAVSSDNNDREIYTYIYDYDAARPPASGTWKITFANNSSAPVPFHAWLADYSIGGSTVSVTGGNTSYTLGNNEKNAIIVGAYVSRWRWFSTNGSGYTYNGTDRSDNIASFSSLGPTRDGRTKPDIAAPGQGIASCKSSGSSVDNLWVLPGDQYRINQGTSMSCPVTTGAVALLLQYSHSMAYSTIRSYISSNAMTDSYTGTSLPNNTWGGGKLDVFKAMTKMYDPGLSFQRNVLLYDQWNTTSSTSIPAGTKIAVKFTPSMSGKLSGCLFHPAFHSLSSPLQFEVWDASGSGGLPGSKLGPTLSLDQSKVAMFSWNFFNMLNVNYPVTTGSDFYIVIYFNSGSSEFFLDSGNSDGRSYTNSGSGWTASSSDFRIRTIVSSDVSILPVELISFSTSVRDNKVVLNWSTATELNSYMFEVERMKISGTGKTGNAWQKIGQIKAAGNSNSPKDYSFEDKDLITANYSYRLKMIDLDGSWKFSEAVSAELIKPRFTGLMQNFPNPFNPSTKINYSIASDCHVKLIVYNILGSQVATLSDEFKPAGNYTVEFDGSRLAAGMYLYKLDAGPFSQAKKFILIK